MRIPRPIGWLIAPLALSLAVRAEAADDGIHQFLLETTSGSKVRFATSDSPVNLVLFLSAVCPMAGDYSQRIAALQERFAGRGVRFLLVNANEHESNEEVRRHASLSHLPAPVYRDPGARVAGLLGAVATPTAVVVDAAGRIRYWGAIDDARNPQRVRRRYVEDAVESLLAGRSVEIPRTKTMGCTIKSSGQ